MADNRGQLPVIALSIERPRTLADIVKWAELAEALDFPSSSPVDLNSIGTTTLRVQAYIGQVDAPEIQES